MTVTGCEHVITGDHMMAMKEHAILSNAGHFNVEIDMEWLGGKRFRGKGSERKYYGISSA